MNQREGTDDIHVRLAALPRPTLDAATNARIHARARDTFASERAAPATAGRWARLWSRALEPAAVAIAVVVYLVWTTQALAAIDWGRLTLSSVDRVGSVAVPQTADGPQND